jgi:hypothetical protein
MRVTKRGGRGNKDKNESEKLLLLLLLLLGGLLENR